MSVMGKALSFLQGSGNNGGEFMKKTGDTYIYLSEFLGTFIFLLCGIGCVGALRLAGAGFGQWEISIVWGLAVAMGVYVCGGVCGAHLNPVSAPRRWPMPWITTCSPMPWPPRRAIPPG